MRKYLLAMLFAFILAAPSFAADDDLFYVENNAGQVVRIDQDAQMVGLKATVEAVSTSDTITAAESGKTFHIKSAGTNTVTMTLPDAAEGLEFTFVSGNTNIVYIDPQSADVIYYLTMTAGEKLQSPTTPATADSVTLVALNDSVWMVKSMFRTWQDGN